MALRRQKIDRHLGIIAQLRDKPLSSKDLAHGLTRRKVAACPKTVQRDIQNMRAELNAPIDYDETTHSYCLQDHDWTYPSSELLEDERFACLFALRLGQPILPPMLQEAASSVTRIQLAACEPGELPPELLDSLIPATSSKVLPSEELFELILDAWRNAECLRITYQDDAGTTRSRRIEPHVLFLHDGAWYIRGYCHLRRGVRNFAIHRCLTVKLLPESFTRSEAIATSLHEGNPFDFDEVQDVTIHCDALKAPVLRERHWFPGQTMTEHPDGSLTLHFPSAPKPLLIRWVLSYSPRLVVLEPESLRQTIAVVASEIHRQHSGRSR